MNTIKWYIIVGIALGVGILIEIIRAIIKRKK